MEHDLRVTGRDKSAAPGAKGIAKFLVIIDFTVEHQDHIAVFAADGLVPASEINDPKAHCAQRNIRRLVESLLVRTAVDQRPDGVSNTVWAYTMEPMRETGDSAQSVTPLRQNRRNRNSGRESSPNAKIARAWPKLI